MDKIKVVVRELANGDVHFLQLTKEQYKILEWLESEDLLEGDVTFEEITDIFFKEI